MLDGDRMKPQSRSSFFPSVSGKHKLNLRIKLQMLQEVTVIASIVLTARRLDAGQTVEAVLRDSMWTNMKIHVTEII